MKHGWNFARVPRACLAGVSIVFLTAIGCAKFDPGGGGFNDGTAHWADKHRAPTAGGQLSGFDSRAQEIERNLGVR